MYGAVWQLGCKDSVEVHYIKSAVQKSVSTTTIFFRCLYSTDAVQYLYCNASNFKRPAVTVPLVTIYCVTASISNFQNVHLKLHRRMFAQRCAQLPPVSIGPR
jgi:hypothetical protein